LICTNETKTTHSGLSALMETEPDVG
jgi:hypothetical protein